MANQKMNQGMLLSRILWPAADDEYPAETNQRITVYLRQFIEMACSKDLKDLLKFWFGWEVAKESLAVEVVNGEPLPTCFCILRLPGHYKDYQSFRMDLIMCIGSCKYGFGHI
ncbi:hypothetical protein AMELA_G00169280 [Ameiurus melas]|uniref:HECT domain-containing protein n=1 Tax=Ameiurus melas TaxID=219545 RepID=A0A7J6AC24_AMEME|nr:hypothetical protein AMELA_G00169280 [Ameiurus melas]